MNAVLRCYDVKRFMILRFRSTLPIANLHYAAHLAEMATVAP